MLSSWYAQGDVESLNLIWLAPPPPFGSRSCWFFKVNVKFIRLRGDLFYPLVLAVHIS